MSYILDALRKSELERQMASGSHVSLLYPVPVDAARGWREPSLLIAAIGLILAAAMLAWWLYSPGEGRSSSSVKSPVAVAETALAVEVKPTPPVPVPEQATPEKTVATLPPPGGKPIPQMTKKVELETPEKAVVTLPPPGGKPIPHMTKKVELEVSAGENAKAAMTRGDANLVSANAKTSVAEKAEVASDNLPKDFPALSITGYIRDDQGNSLAMINDRLVHEGEDIEPGLRLEKILGENSVFVFKGRRYRR